MLDVTAALKGKKPEFNIDSILNNPVDAKNLKGKIDEALLDKQKVADANSHLADIRTQAKDDLGIPPGIFNHLVNVKYRESLAKEKDKFDTAESTLGKLYGDSAEVKKADFDHNANDFAEQE